MRRRYRARRGQQPRCRAPPAAETALVEIIGDRRDGNFEIDRIARDAARFSSDPQLEKRPDPGRLANFRR
jgi:hypothetical protein